MNSEASRFVSRLARLHVAPLLAAAVLAFAAAFACIAPAPAYADGPELRVGSAVMHEGEYLLEGDTAPGQGMPPLGSTSYLLFDKNTIVLKDFNYVCTDDGIPAALHVRGVSGVCTIELRGDNSISAPFSTRNHAILAECGLAFIGAGSLNAVGGNAAGEASLSAGIVADSISFAGGSVTAIGGAAQGAGSTCYAICARSGDIVVENRASVTGKLGMAEGECVGIDVAGAVRVLDGSLSAIAGNSSAGPSYGMRVAASGVAVEVAAGMLSSVAGAGATESCGVFTPNGGVSVTGGVLSASGLAVFGAEDGGAPRAMRTAGDVPPSFAEGLPTIAGEDSLAETPLAPDRFPDYAFIQIGDMERALDTLGMGAGDDGGDAWVESAVALENERRAFGQRAIASVVALVVVAVVGGVILHRRRDA